VISFPDCLNVDDPFCELIPASGKGSIARYGVKISMEFRQFCTVSVIMEQSVYNKHGDHFSTYQKHNY